MRARNYAQLRRERKEKHWYFMALDKEEVVDASRRGGLTRFLNHSCEPNAVLDLKDGHRRSDDQKLQLAACIDDISARELERETDRRPNEEVGRG